MVAAAVSEMAAVALDEVEEEDTSDGVKAGGRVEIVDATTRSEVGVLDAT